MSSIPRASIEQAGWLKTDDKPILERLRYPFVGTPPLVRPENIATRDLVLADMVSGEAAPTPVKCCLGGLSDILVAEVDRYGLPVRTVVSEDTGLMRTDPYYDSLYLSKFYRDHYRNLYSVHVEPSRFFSEQVVHGDKILSLTGTQLPLQARVLEIGCGMGGILIPFVVRGCQAFGCDWGSEYLNVGRRFGLQLIEGGYEAVERFGPFDLVILSHVLEHCVDPIGFLNGIRKLMASTAILYVEVPGILGIRHAYDGDFLRYIQNAHVWHFTGCTLSAVLRRSGFAVAHVDESIQCLARKNSVDNSATCDNHQSVLAEIRNLENAMRGKHRMISRAVRLARRARRRLFQS